MIDIKQIESELLEYDGSLIDVNFEIIDEESLSKVLVHLLENFNLAAAQDNTDQNVVEIVKSVKLMKSYLLKNKQGFIQSTWKNNKELIEFFQVFISWSDISSIYVEMSFSPKDINKNLFNFAEFVGFLKKIFSCLKTDVFYVRHENQSWQYGDISPSSGVIFTSKEVPLQNSLHT